MSTPLTRTHQSKLAGDLKSALTAAGHQPMIVTNWEPDLEVTVGEGSHILETIQVFAGSRSIQVGDKEFSGDNFSGRGFTDKMVAAILEALPPAPAPAPAPVATPAASKASTEVKAAKSNAKPGSPPPKQGIYIAAPRAQKKAPKPHPRAEKDGVTLFSKNPS